MQALARAVENIRHWAYPPLHVSSAIFIRYPIITGLPHVLSITSIHHKQGIYFSESTQKHLKTTYSIQSFRFYNQIYRAQRF